MKRILSLILSVLLLAGMTAQAVPAKKTETVTYAVSIHCQNCVNKLTDKLSFMNGVKDLKISLKDKSVMIKYDPAKIGEDQFVEQIRKLGYTAEKIPAGK